jgi:hypothetical protein
MTKPASKVFKSIRFSKLDPGHQKAGPFSTDDEEHYTVSTQEYEQQVKHVKKRAMQEAKKLCWDGFKSVPGKKPYSPGSCVKESSPEKEIGDDPTGSSAQETLVKKGGKTTVAKPIAEASSVAVRMHNALERIKQKREASEQRGREVLQPKKPEQKPMQKEEVKPPFDGPYKKTPTDITDKSGAVHTAQSRVRHLARTAMKAAGARQANSVGAKTMKESSLVESRKTDIIKDAADSAKKKKSVKSDKFEANPVLDSQIQKVDNT